MAIIFTTKDAVLWSGLNVHTVVVDNSIVTIRYAVVSDKGSQFESADFYQWQLIDNQCYCAGSAFKNSIDIRIKTDCGRHIVTQDRNGSISQCT